MHIDFATQTRTYLGLYEIELNRYFRRILKRGLPSFDVGAQYGYDALMIAKRTHARVAAFESDEVCVARMATNFALNDDITALIHAVHATIGDKSDQTGLDSWTYSGGFVPGFIKIDIEGAEVAALRSAERILRERHPALIVEVHSRELERDCSAILSRHGYETVVVSQRRIAQEHRPIEHNRWLVAS
jgi:hypothetical protein